MPQTSQSRRKGHRRGDRARQWALVTVSATAVLAAWPAAAQENPVVLRGARVLPIASPPIEDGAVVAEDGKIVWVGPSSELDMPRRAEVYELRGKVVMPGFVDTHSHLGEVAGGDRSAALHPEVRTLDSVNIRNPNFWRARAGGITTVNVMSGSGHLLSGQTTYLKLRNGGTKVEDWLFCDDPLTEICGGLKMANGTNSMRGKPFPGTRAKSAAMVRGLLVKAQEYMEKNGGTDADAEEIDDGDEDDQAGESKAPKRDLGMEALAEVLRGERIVQYHTHRHDDILTIIRVSKEFGFRPVLHHVSEAWIVADEIAAAGLPVSLTIVDSPGGKEEVLRFSMRNGAALEEAGVAVAFNTDDSILDSRLILRSAALSVRYGMSRQKALEGLTLAPARMLGLDDRVGSLEAGKDADFVILSGDPLSVYTKVEQTWVEGELVFDRSRAEDHSYAVGGYDTYRDMEAHDEL